MSIRYSAAPRCSVVSFMSIIVQRGVPCRRPKMLRAFYDLINHPEEYQAIWRNGELYVEPIADEVGGSRDNSADIFSERFHESDCGGAGVSLDEAPAKLPSKAA
jgi:hypothetical protein